MTKLISVILSLTVVIFLANGLAEDLPTGAIARIDVGEGRINAIAYSRVSNRIAITAAENIRIYDASTYKELIVLAGHKDSVLSLAFSPNGKRLASGSSDKTVRLWDVTTGQHLRTLTGHIGEIGAVTFLGDKALAGIGFAEAKALATGSSDGTVFIWDLDKITSTD